MRLYVILFCACFLADGSDTDLLFEGLVGNSSEDIALATVCQNPEDEQGLLLLQKHAQIRTAKVIRVNRSTASQVDNVHSPQFARSHHKQQRPPFVLLFVLALILIGLFAFIFYLTCGPNWMSSGEVHPPAQVVVLQTKTNQNDDCEEVEIEDSENESPIAQESSSHFRFSWRKLWRYMGPGWLMSLTYVDPGSLTSDLQQGGYTGFTLVWVLWWTTVVGLIFQELSARLGVVTGRDLAQHVRSEYPSWLNYTVYIMMEVAVITADIQEILGSAVAIFLLSNGWIPVWVGALMTGVDTFTFVAVSYLGIRYLEALICFLISCMTISFFINWAETGVDAAALVKGWIVPTMPFYAMTQAIGIIGSVIMPHNLYLHSGLVLSRKINRFQINKVHEATWYNFLESGLALLTSFFINLAIVATNAGQFFNSTCADTPGGPYACMSPKALDGDVSLEACHLPHGGTGRCSSLGLQSEAYALKHGIGDLAMYVWAFGLLASGQASTMTCTYAGQIIMGGCLEVQLAPWKRIAVTRALALGPAVLVTVATIGNNRLFSNVNEWINVIQSIQLPFAMLPLMYFCSKERLMHQFSSSWWAVLLNSTLVGIVFAANAVLIVQFTARFSEEAIFFVCVVTCFYLFLCFRMIKP